MHKPCLRTKSRLHRLPWPTAWCGAAGIYPKLELTRAPRKEVLENLSTHEFLGCKGTSCLKKLLKGSTEFMKDKQEWKHNAWFWKGRMTNLDCTGTTKNKAKARHSLKYSIMTVTGTKIPQPGRHDAHSLELMAPATGQDSEKLFFSSIQLSHLLKIPASMLQKAVLYQQTWALKDLVSTNTLTSTRGVNKCFGINPLTVALLEGERATMFTNMAKP